MIVTNAFNSTLNTQAAAKGFSEIKPDSPMRPLIDFLSGNEQVPINAKMTWNQALLYQLLVRNNPSESLQ